MKRLILVLLLMVTSPAIAGPGNVVQFVGIPPSGGSACATVVDSSSGGTSIGKFGDATFYARAGSWTTSDAYSICKIKLEIAKTGSPTGTVTCKIHSNDSNKPGTVLGTSSVTYEYSEISTSYAYLEFTFSPAISLDTATRYHVSVTSDTLNDADNYFKLRYNNSGTEYLSSYATSWATADPSAIMNFEAYE